MAAHSDRMNKNGNRHTREERLQVMLLPEEIRAIDDFRFAARMPSRAAAIRELLKRGLAAGGFAIATEGSRSSEYGVTGSSPGGTKTDDEKMLVNVGRNGKF